MSDLSISEASALTGLSRHTIRGYIRDGLPRGPLSGKHLPAKQVPGRGRTGKEYRIKRSDLERADLIPQTKVKRSRNGMAPVRSSGNSYIPLARASATSRGSRTSRAQEPDAASGRCAPAVAPPSGRVQSDEVRAELVAHETRLARIESRLEELAASLARLSLDEVRETPPVREPSRDDASSLPSPGPGREDEDELEQPPAAQNLNVDPLMSAPARHPIIDSGWSEAEPASGRDTGKRWFRRRRDTRTRA